jgi:hypothetical protein
LMILRSPKTFRTSDSSQFSVVFSISKYLKFSLKILLFFQFIGTSVWPSLTPARVAARPSGSNTGAHSQTRVERDSGSLHALGSSSLAGFPMSSGVSIRGPPSSCAWFRDGHSSGIATELECSYFWVRLFYLNSENSECWANVWILPLVLWWGNGYRLRPGVWCHRYGT